MDDRHDVSCAKALVRSLHRLLRDEQVKGFNPVIAASER
jgi:hypothetical protein